jgi:hypothetical protein
MKTSLSARLVHSLGVGDLEGSVGEDETGLEQDPAQNLVGLCRQ